MHRFLQHIAIMLLLLFSRAMVPDALVVSFHTHAHTEHTEPVDPSKAQLGEKHTHCPVESLFGAPYQGKTASVELLPVQHIAVLVTYETDKKQGTVTTVQRLRGPPLV